MHPGAPRLATRHTYGRRDTKTTEPDKTDMDRQSSKPRRALMGTLFLAATVACAPGGDTDPERRNPASEPGREEPAAQSPVAVVQATPAFVEGEGSARVVVEEYSDFQCPFCARQHLENNLDLRSEFVPGTAVRYEFYDIAAPAHAQAALAARAARCAGEQDAYHKAQRLLFDAQSDWAGERGAEQAIRNTVTSVVSDSVALEACLTDGSRRTQALAVLDANLQRGLEQGIEGTPTFIIRAPDDHEVRMVKGALDADRLRRALDEMGVDLARAHAGAGSSGDTASASTGGR